MFKNIPLTDFSLESNRISFQKELKNVLAQLKHGPFKAGVLLNGEEYFPSITLERKNPSDSSMTYARIHLADEDLCDRALQDMSKTQCRWRNTPTEQRIAILHKVGEAMTIRRQELASLIVLEAGKSWKEADADVAEAIDFCHYYGEEMKRLSPARKTSEVAGEDNIYFYEPRGLAVVISPWNFPLAITCGMTVAALVTGNSVILKPAEQTSYIAFEFGKILLQSGIPPYAFTLLTGVGEVVGKRLTQSPLVHLICFTGSKQVGLEIIRTSAELGHGQQHVKKVIAEMGGKNAIIVDEDADLDEAVKGVLTSAFGYAGQKCSACSRVIIVGEAYEPFLARLSEAVNDIIIGNVQEAATFLGPVIDEESKVRIEKVIERAKQEYKLVLCAKPPSQGFFVGPVIFRDVLSSSFLWREEVFGPVLACTQAGDISKAIMLANDSEYALTGGLYSRSPSNIELVKREFCVGNLYINRGCTGALVCRQPFGGFRLSGIGSKAGGPDYLLQFMEPRTITENTMRRGFAPGI